MKITDIKENENNPRHISQDKLDKLKKSLKGFEKMLEVRPIIVDENNIIIGGNQRYKAMVALGYTSLKEEWVNKIEGLTDKQKQELIVKDNINYGYWEWEKLEIDFIQFDLKYWGIDTPFKFEKIEAYEQPTIMPDGSVKNITINNNYGQGLTPDNNMEGRLPSIDYTEKMDDMIDVIFDDELPEDILIGDIRTTKYITLTLEENEIESFKDFMGIKDMKRILNISQMKKII